VLGNGKLIKLWSDNILENPPLESVEELIPLKSRLLENGYQNISNIKEWSEEGRCKGWESIPPPKGQTDRESILYSEGKAIQ
jgi:hypothetical protein